MRTEAFTFLSIAVFSAVIGLVYFITSGEPTGSVLLGVTSILGLLPGIYLYRQSRVMEPRPSDRPDALPGDEAGPVGSFPASSIWPFVIAGGVALTGVGLVFGLWSALPGLVLVAIAFVGGSLESRSPH
jgi:predicted membrane-bound spermidine synthase